MQAGIPAWLNALLAIGGLGTLVSGLALWFKHWRDSNIAEKKDGREADRDSVETFTAWRQEAVASAREAGKLAREVSSLRDTLTEHARRIEALEDDQAHLVGYVTVVIAGIDAGTVPPLPPMPPTVAAILSHIIRKEPHEE